MQSQLTFRSICAALLIFFIVLPASADSWNYGTRVGLSSDWNDNPSLADDTFDTDATFRFLASYDGEFERQSKNSSFNLRPRITTDYYPDSKFSDLQATDIFLPGNFNYRRPLSSWILGFNASQQSVLSDEATTSQGSTIGTLSGDDTLKQFSLSPSTVWQVSEKDEITFGINYSITDYDLEFTNRSDTTSIGSNISYSRSLNERHAVGISGFISSSDADRRALVPFPFPPEIPVRFDDGKVTTDSSSSFLTADYDYAVNAASTLQISYGIQDATTESTTTNNITGKRRSSGSLSFGSSTFNINYVTEFYRGQYAFGASRDVTLDITNGQPQDRYQVTFDGEYRLTERLLGSWRLIAWEQEAVALKALDENGQAVSFSSKPKYASADFRLDWNITKKWYFNSRYEYRWRSNDQRIGNNEFNLKAVSNNITIGVTYYWKELQRR